MIEAAAEARQEATHYHAGRPICSNRNGNDLRAQALALEGCNGSDEDVLTYAMFPQVAAKFFAHRAEGPKNVGKSSCRRQGQPSAADARAKPSNGKQPVSVRVTYNVKVGDKSHQVTVEPV